MKTIFLLFSFICVSSYAQTSKPVPTYFDAMNQCMMYAKNNAPDGQFSDALASANAEAMCQCRYENLPKKPAVTENEFMRAAKICLAERQADSKSNFFNFGEKYFARINRELLGNKR
jgi:hypothetical protein